MILLGLFGRLLVTLGFGPAFDQLGRLEIRTRLVNRLVVSSRPLTTLTVSSRLAYRVEVANRPVTRVRIGTRLVNAANAGNLPR